MPRPKTFTTELAKHQTLLRGVFAAMKWRFYKLTAKPYPNYGGRGITICDEWLSDSEQFVAWALANDYAEGLEIDRIDNDGHYAPESCRFVPYKHNVRNRRNTMLVDFNHEQRPFGEVFEILTGYSYEEAKARYNGAISRVKHGWSVVEACTAPIGNPGRPHKA